MKKIAAIVTVYRPRSHADVLVGKFLHAVAIAALVASGMRYK